ncbi:hypothetical protein HZC31_03770 [Candidatus Woesearchaeota archaeon]|nr:hypothetical protein [Candidatus Woesearchaeota archaeon]
MQRLHATLETAVSAALPDIFSSLPEDTGDWVTTEPTYVSDTGFMPVVPSDIENTLDGAFHDIDSTAIDVLAPAYANIAIDYMNAEQINLLFYRTLQDYRDNIHDYKTITQGICPSDGDSDPIHTYSSKDYNMRALLAALPPEQEGYEQINAVYGLFQTLDEDVQVEILKKEIYWYALKQDAVGTRNQVMVVQKLVDTLIDAEFQVTCKPLEEKNAVLEENL